MRLIPVNIESIRIGHPLPFPLVDKDGILLARKAYVIDSHKDLREISQRGGGLFVDVADAQAQHRAYVDHLYGLVRDEKPIGEIADTKISRESVTEKQAVIDDRMDWFDLQVVANSLLRDTNPVSFRERLNRLQRQLLRHSQRNPDGTLFALIYLSASELEMYSATHAMLVSVICFLASKDVLNWPVEEQTLVGLAALTMNFGVTDLQDKLALQIEPPTPAQKSQMDKHAPEAAALLADMGIDDPIWLEIVRTHHTQPPGPFAGRDEIGRMARLLQRADMFAARLSPRASRQPISPAAAMQACYFDENRKIDEAGAALIKAVGIYQPGSFVRLATNEIAVVILRGRNTTTPRVGVLINRSGVATVEPIMRDTSVPEYRIVASVAQRDVKVKLNLKLLTELTKLDRMRN